MPIKFGFTAQQIINEGRVTNEDIQLLKTWLETQNLPNLTDEQIVLFLLSCDNEQEATKTTIKAYYSIRNKIPDIFNDRKLQREDLQKIFDVSHVCVLPERTDDGCAILVSRMNDTNYKNADMRAYFTNLCMAIDVALYEHPPTGLIILSDQKGMGIMHLTKIKLGLYKVFLEYLQEGLPVKLKTFHNLNCYSILDKLMIMARPFLSKEVVEKVQFHPTGMNMDSFYKNWIPKRCLPEDYGGDLPSVSILHEKHIKKIADMESFFDAEEEQRRSIEK